MIEMTHDSGDTILAHPSKVESLKNMGWRLAGEAPKPKAKPVKKDTKESEED
jgi:hypothetical protein